MVTVDESGTRREWGFGELIARSAGLAGALEARGVSRGDVVMTLIGNRVEWVLAMLACFRIGAVALPCNTQLRRADLEHRVAVAGPALCVGEERWLGELPGRHAVHDLDRDRRGPRRGAPAGAAGDSGRPRPRRSGADRLHVGNDRPAAGRGPPAALPARPAPPGRALARRPQRRARLVHRGHGLVEVGAQRRSSHPGWRGAAAYLHDARFDPAERLGDLRARGHQRALPGADRVPDARQADRAAAGPLAAPDGLRRRAAQRRGDRAPSASELGPRHPRRLRTDRDRSADRRR